nr:hypothetical protein [Tanacetum cinerariifolium]
MYLLVAFLRVLVMRWLLELRYLDKDCTTATGKTCRKRITLPFFVRTKASNYITNIKETSAEIAVNDSTSSLPGFCYGRGLDCNKCGCVCIVEGC